MIQRERRFLFIRMNVMVIVSIAMALLLTSCEEILDPAVEVSADAGQNTTVKVGEEVSLDGSNSTASEGDLLFAWNFEDVPEGSSVQLASPTSQNPSFVPDQAGDYKVKLVVTVDSYSDEDMVTITAESPGLEAMAGEDQTVSTGTEVELDGSNSFPRDGSISYSWSFSDMPSGSQVALTEDETATPSFTPDASGDYVIELEVSDGDETDTDEVVITATAASIEVYGSISSATTWTDHVDDPSVPDYLLTGDVSVNAELTIKPGVLIHANENVRLNIKSGGGVLLAEGESGNPIVMTSSNEAGSVYWGGIDIQSTDNRNIIRYAEVKYGGGTEMDFADFVDLGANIGLRDDGALNLENTTVSHGKAYGMYIRDGELNEFENNNFENNALVALGLNLEESSSLDDATTYSGNPIAVEIYGSSLSGLDQVYLPKLASDARYYISGDLKIDSYFSADPGAKFDLAEDVKIEVQQNGTFVADATDGETIVFTSAKANSGIYWKGLNIQSKDARNLLANVEVSYAGNSNWGGFADFVDLKANVAVMEGGKLGITSSTISNGNGYGLYIRYGSLESFSGNTFSGNTLNAIGLEADQAGNIDSGTSFSNNGWDGVEVFGSTLDQESTWVKLNGTAKYRLTGTVKVHQGLSLDPGVHVVVDENHFIRVDESGYFNAEGFSSNRIILTTSNIPGQIHWGGLWIETSDARNVLDYVDIAYGGGDEMDLDNFKDVQANVGGDQGAKVTITNSHIDNSADYGVYFQGTINAISDAGAGNSFTGNLTNTLLP